MVNKQVKWRNNTPHLIPLILAYQTSPIVISLMDRDHLESLANQQPKPYHILTQTLERLAGTDKTCLTH